MLFKTLLILLSTSPHLIVSEITNTSQSDDWPLQQIAVDSVTEHSIALSWDAPNTNLSTPLLYTIHYEPLKSSEMGLDLDLGANTTFIVLPDLEEGTTYSFTLTTVFDNIPEVTTPTLLVTTLIKPLPYDSDSYPDLPIECNCSSTGMVACVRTTISMKCACFPGYEGVWCELCSSMFYWNGSHCHPCPCTNFTSAGNCLQDPKKGLVMCTTCKPGHSGPSCQACLTGYTWKGNHCVLECQDCQSLLCPSCQQLPQNSNHQSDNSKMPLFAFLVSLCAIASVAFATIGYHYWCRVRPIHIPFWSIELREDSCQYQFLEPGGMNAGETNDRSPSSTIIV